MKDRINLNPVTEIEMLTVLYRVLNRVVDLPEAGAGYAKKLKKLTEKIHVPGVRDVREVEFPDNLKLSVDLGDRLGCYYFYGFSPERTEAEFFLNLLPEKGVMLDIGANIGSYTLRCSKRSPELDIYAFEPSVSAYELLCLNVKENKTDSKVRCLDVAVSSRQGREKFYEAAESSFSGFSDNRRADVKRVSEVNVTTLDAFAEERGIESVNGIKIDVEGFETEVLRGGRSLFNRSSDLFMMLEYSIKNLNENKKSEFFEELGNLIQSGFNIFAIDTDKRLIRINKVSELEEFDNTNLFLFSDRFLEMKDVVAVFNETVGNSDDRRSDTISFAEDFLTEIVSGNDELIGNFKAMLKSKDAKLSELKNKNREQGNEFRKRVADEKERSGNLKNMLIDSKLRIRELKSELADCKKRTGRGA